jgi:hypothetical protein
MTTGTLDVGRKKTPAGSSGGKPSGKATIKIDVEMHRRARTVASYMGMEITEYLESLIGPAVDHAYAEMARKIQQSGGNK